MRSIAEATEAGRAQQRRCDRAARTALPWDVAAPAHDEPDRCATPAAEMSAELAQTRERRRGEYPPREQNARAAHAQDAGGDAEEPHRRIDAVRQSQ